MDVVNGSSKHNIKGHLFSEFDFLFTDYGFCFFDSGFWVSDFDTQYNNTWGCIKATIICCDMKNCKVLEV